MFAVHCEECDRTYLVSAHSIEALYAVEPGVIVVELSCLRGHPVTVRTGQASPAVALPRPRPEDEPAARVPDRVPAQWTRTYGRRPGLAARVAAFFRTQAWMIRRFDYRAA